MLASRAATAVDAPFLAEILEMAARGHLARGPWDLLVPDDAERHALLRTVATSESISWCHARDFRVLEIDGVAAAAMTSFAPASLPTTSLAPVMAASLAARGWSEERLGAALIALAPYAECFPDFPDDAWIVENVGTRAAFRRRGLVRRLLDEALARGRAAGFRTAQISCLVGNEPARRAYEQAGFRIVEERKSAAFEALVGAPGFWRMTQPL